MIEALFRKLTQLRSWGGSVLGPADWPGVVVLTIFRTRPPTGLGVVHRVARQLFPFVWIRPKALRGYGLRLNPSRMSQFVIYEEVFIDNAYDLEKVAFQPDTVIDCGAFHGYFTLCAKARFGGATVLAFEPNAENFGCLLANIAANDLAVDLRNEAVSTNDGEAQFSGAGCGGRLVADGDTNSVRVRTCDLRRVLTDLAPERLLLKMDIEGEEQSLLPWLLAVMPRQCALFVEWHHGESGFQDAVRMLEAAGFSVERKRTMVDDAGVAFIDAFAQRC